MPYKLKANAPEFDVVDGPMTGKKYRHGKTYPDIPPGEKDRFVETRHALPVPEKSKSATKPAAKKNDASDVKIVASEKPRGGSK